MQQFLDEAQAIQFDDNRIDTARLAMTGGPGLRQAAKDALTKSPEELEAFLLYGFEVPLDDDRKVDIARLVTLGDYGVREAGKKALQGTADDRELFLNTGQYEALEDDNRVETARLATIGGPNVKAAAKVALRGTAEDIQEFLDVGQFIARNRDQEHASIAELIDSAKTSGQLAEDATKQAEEASAKAVTASALAKEAAEKAAKETESAKNDSKKAAVKAQQAADAARAAADAAQQAIGAANAASSAARRASIAAAQTAAAAAAAGEATNKAYKAAIAAAGDQAKASEAATAAKQARDVAAALESSAAAADLAGEASANAAIAAKAAKSATANSRAAADAADDANAYADAAGLHSEAARQAAAEARRNAAVADAAADRSAALATRAATAAFGARDAANSAAAHAKKAAGFAEEAAEQAGNTATYAAVAQKNADGALAASDAVDAAVAKAKGIYDLARETEDADLQTRTDAAIERARSMKMSTEAGISASAATQVEALSLNDTAAQLADEAARPDADLQATAAKGRRLALQAMESLGPWHQEAAARALSGTDQDVLDYLRTRWKEADQSDIRERVVDLSNQSPYASVRTAAAAALNGTPEQVESFYTDGQYQAGLDDMKVDVARLAETGDTNVSTYAKAALANGTGKVLATYLHIGQYGERLTDEKVITARLAQTGGPELSAAAKVALAGPPNLIHDFVTTGQYMAQRKDDLTNVHVHQVERLLAEGALISAQAKTDAWHAAEAAAEAKQATADATKAAAEADKSAELAEKYKNDAQNSAQSAAQSAAAAAESAITARNAADRADAEAQAAEDSAYQAEFSANYARNTAADARNAADEAKASAEAAGDSKAEAEQAAEDAWRTVITLAEKEKAEAERQEKERRKAEEGSDARKPFCMDLMGGIAKIPGINTVICTDFFNEVKDVVTDPETYKTLAWELSGLADVKKCIEDPTLLDCVMAVVGVTPWGKLKIVAKIEKGIETVKAGRAVRRTVSCLAGAAHSFLAGTSVLMADGTKRPIERIGVGDLVIATDPATGETGPHAVTRSIRTPDDREFTDVTLVDGSTISSTRHHPYWSENDRMWKTAGDLDVGDRLRTPQKETVTVAKKRDWKGLREAFDLTVDGLHTYYVSAGRFSVLVHNTGEECPGWVIDAYEALPYSPPGGGTSGLAFFEDGTPYIDDLLRSGRDANAEQIFEYLNKLDEFKHWPGYNSLAGHVETKLAWLMRKKGKPGETVDVVINKNFVCPRVDGPNDVGCKQTVPAILPKGMTINVHYPGYKEPLPLEGKADWDSDNPN
ncbi:DddA-like double-stranded DNA deaminase toxin [Streptomyces sp. 130]|uniref:DddA-like double-stranded DNA deaminase toxin n=1 Tax=Streptomyces sp. 130 TaxID=2591006 RepID=UPI0037DA10F5